ncbi:MAG: hypothetical protein AB1442_02245 [Nitrospirota bacterium]
MSFSKRLSQRGQVFKLNTSFRIRRHTDTSNEDIAGYFGIGYTAVSQTASRVKREMGKNKELRKMVQAVEKELLSDV